MVAARGYLLEGDAEEASIRKAAILLADSIAERTVMAPVGSGLLNHLPAVGGKTSPVGREWVLVHVLPKPGVMDPVALSTQKALQDLRLPISTVRTLRKYWVAGADQHQLQRLCQKILSNDSIEQVVVGALNLNQLAIGSPYHLKLTTVPIRKTPAEELQKLSREWQLYLSPAEMESIQEHFRKIDRDPTDIELETIAQTWSEHCSHKTLAGRIDYSDENGNRHSPICSRKPFLRPR